MFFECPITKSYRPKLESTRLGLLSVTGGDLSIPGIVNQLQRLVPVENFAWECRQVGQNVFKVTFPDKDELERLTRFGTFLVPNSNIKLNFEQCVSSMEPTSKLPEVSVLMSGIPKRRIGNFLAMWSLGTMFGKTIKVDMVFTRENGVLRILVGCLDFTRIPAKERIYIADGFYDITFEVENHSNFEMPTVANLEDGPSDNDGNGNNGDQSNSEPKHGRDAMDTDTTPSLASMEEASRSTSSGLDVNKLASDFSSGVRFSPKVKMVMDQSRAELRILAEALSATATATAEATSPLPDVIDLPRQEMLPRRALGRSLRALPPLRLPRNLVRLLNMCQRPMRLRLASGAHLACTMWASPPNPRHLPRLLFVSLKVVRERFYRERRRLLLLSSLRRKPTNFLQAREILGAEVWRNRPLALWPPKSKFYKPTLHRW
jgi:hypothetical protein